MTSQSTSRISFSSFEVSRAYGHVVADDGMYACHIAFKHMVFIRKVATLFVMFTIPNTDVFSRPVI